MLTEENGPVYPSNFQIDNKHLPIIKGIIANYEGVSGVRIRINENGRSFVPPPAEVTDTREELVSLAESRMGIDYQSEQQQYPLRVQYEEYAAGIGRKLRGGNFLGGIDMTGRSMKDSEAVIPGLERMLADTRGKIVFIGNGLSVEPVQFVTDLFKQKKVDSPPVICDLFDYQLFYRDLKNLHLRFLDSQHNPSMIPFPFERDLEALQTMIDLRDQRLLVFSPPYRFGEQKSLPTEIQNAELVVSIMGPPTDTLEDQLRLLSPGGSILFYSKKKLSIPHGFTVISLDNKDPSFAHKITKNI